MQRKWLFAIPILLVLFALCVAMVGIVVISARRMTANGIPFLAMGEIKVSVEDEEQQVFDARPAGTLVVDNPCGDVSVSASQGAQVAVTALKRAWGRDTGHAQENLAKIELSLTQDGDAVRVGLPGALQDCLLETNLPFSVDYTVQVPVETAVRLDTQAGNIGLVGTQGPAELTSQFGSVNVDRLTGRLTITSQNGEITGREIQAGVEPIELKSTFGSVHLNAVDASRLAVNSINGEINLADVVVSGPVTLTSDFGSLSWDGGSGQSLAAETKNGRVDFQNLAFSEALQVSSDFGDIQLDQVQAAGYTAASKNGKISLGGVAGEVTARSDFGDIAVDGVGNLRLDLNSQNGAIYVTGSLADGTHTLHTRFGDVRLRLPEEAAFNFDLQTNFGKISSAFPVTIQGAPNETHWQGTVNGGGASLTASTENGNILIEYNQ